MVADEEIDLMIMLWPPAWKIGFTSTRGEPTEPSQKGSYVATNKDTQPPQTTTKYAAVETLVGYEKWWPGKAHSPVLLNF